MCCKEFSGQSRLTPVTMNNFEYHKITSEFLCTGMSFNTINDQNNEQLETSGITSEIVRLGGPTYEENASERKFIEMPNNCIEVIDIESQIETEVKRPEDKENFINDSFQEENTITCRKHFSGSIDVANKPISYQSTGLTKEEIELQNLIESNMFSNVLYNFTSALCNISPDKGGKLSHVEDPMKFEFGLTDNTSNLDYEIFSKEITKSFTQTCHEMSQNEENNSSETVDCDSDISNECLMDILGTDLDEESFDDKNDPRKITCSPPLTLIEKPSKRILASKKVLTKKINKNITPKVLPSRVCQSKYINQSKRSADSDKLPEESKLKTLGIQTKVNKASKCEPPKKTITTQYQRVDEALKRKREIQYYQGSSQKTFEEKKFEEGKETVKVSFLHNMNEIEHALKKITDNTCKWINGEKEHFVTREAAFEMLMETQQIIKTLEYSKVPKRGYGNLLGIKNKLCARAKKLALAIDTAITESDQIFEKQFFKLKKFRKVRKTLSCQKGNQSPSHSVGTPLDLTEAKPSIINTNSEPVEEEKMGNKPLKLPDIDSSIHQDRVLDIIKEQKTPLKETNFSPYTPLPAIGKSSLEGAKRKIVRQKTYRVLEPVYIKGPSDLYKYISNADNLVTESNFKKARKSLNAGDQRNKHSEVFKTLKHADNNSQDTENSSDALNVHLKERDTKPVGFCKSAPGQITKSVNVNNKIDFKSKNVDKENATAFWIDF